MTTQVYAVCFDTSDPAGLARFWGGVLGWKAADDARDGVELLPNDDTGFRLRFALADTPKLKQNQIHFDLTSQSIEDQQATVARAIELGGQRIDIGQGPDARHVVMADPDGNEFCVLEPGNNFLADCGFLGALASDGSQQVGYFWSKALDWPLVWDQDEETAIRSPHGGPKVTWGGPPVETKLGKNRLYFDLATPAGGDQQAEVERLVSLGATRVDGGSDDAGVVAMLDPDGNEFYVLPSA